MNVPKTRKQGGWAVDGIAYPSARDAAQAIGVGQTTLQQCCRKIGRRQVTSQEIAMTYRNSGNDAWRRLSDSSNTGAGREMWP